MNKQKFQEERLLHERFKELSKNDGYMELERTSNSMCRIYETLHGGSRYWPTLFTVSLTIAYLLTGIAVHIKDLNRSKAA